MRVTTAVFFSLLLLLLACGTEKKQDNTNTPEEGFNLEGSDPAAVELADSVMSAMGGRASWNKTRYISWSFSGRRNLVWDKQSGRVRIESPEDNTIYLINVNNGQGRVRVNGREVLTPDSVSLMLQRARGIWINDSYWLIMPFKLKDSGVTLRYLGEDTLMTGAKCNVMDLTFSDAENSSNSKYRIYVDLADNLVKQWAYYKTANQDSATFIRPWDNYKQYGDILLSGDRSDGSGPKNVKVDADLPDKIFTDF
jgi:hypothetical protein